MSKPSVSDAPTILVPVDFDEPSRRAVALAIEYAHALRGRVLVLHVVPPTSFPEGTRLLPVDRSDAVDLREYVSKTTQEKLHAYFAEALLAGIEVGMEVRSGHVVTTILLAAEEHGATMLVVGTHGRTGAARVLLGSVAEKLLRSSPLPVMIARGGTSELIHDPAFVGATTFSGAVAGAAAGGVGGPIGALAGAAVGTVLGVVAGSVMDRQRANEESHEAELDDAIGVTRGSLGTPDETKRPSRDVVGE